LVLTPGARVGPYEIPAPENVTLGNNVVVSPDGRFIAFVSGGTDSAPARMFRPFSSGGSMTVSERTIGSVTLLDLDGRLVLGASAEGLRDKIRSLLQQGQKQFIVNLAGVPYMDSTGLGELVHMYATVTRQGGALKLLNTTSRLHDLLVITKLATVFDCFDNETTALASFAAPA
jgi:anti-sigma B factor antagonist